MRRGARAPDVLRLLFSFLSGVLFLGVLLYVVPSPRQGLFPSMKSYFSTFLFGIIPEWVCNLILDPPPSPPSMSNHFTRDRPKPGGLAVTNSLAVEDKLAKTSMHDGSVGGGTREVVVSGRLAWGRPVRKEGEGAAQSPASLHFVMSFAHHTSQSLLG